MSKIQELNAKSVYTPASARNLTNSNQHPAAQHFVQFLQAAYPDLSKIRFKKSGKMYSLRVHKGRRTFHTKAFSIENTCTLFLTKFNIEHFA